MGSDRRLSLWVASALLGALVPISLWAGTGRSVPAVAFPQPQVQEGRALVLELGCAACHTGLPAAADLAARGPIPGGGGDPDAVAAVLVGGHRPDYRLSAREGEALARFWVRGSDETSPDGAALYAAFGCGGCHGGATALGRGGKRLSLAPDLVTAGDELAADWVAGFLQDPVPIRPAGFHPGTRARMPDFGLSEGEAGHIASYLATLRGAPSVRPPEAPTAWGRARAERYLTDRLSCLGCHQWRGSGGRIAPPLDGLGDRLTHGAVVRAILEPERRGAHSIMPRSPFRRGILDEVAALLVHDTAAWSPGVEPDITWNQQVALASGLVPASGAQGERSEASGVPQESPGAYEYLRRCAQCHGTRGDGGGFNARYLPVAPTALVDATASARRPDDTLYDGIAAGGWVLDKSHRMPAFGRSLPPQTLRLLVGHIRTLCVCQGPDWARGSEGEGGR